MSYPGTFPIVAVGRSIWQEGVAQLSPISQLSYRDNVGAVPELVNQEREEKWQILGESEEKVDWTNYPGGEVIGNRRAGIQVTDALWQKTSNYKIIIFIL